MDFPLTGPSQKFEEMWKDPLVTNEAIFVGSSMLCFLYTELLKYLFFQLKGTIGYKTHPKLFKAIFLSSQIGN